MTTIRHLLLIKQYLLIIWSQQSTLSLSLSRMSSIATWLTSWSFELCFDQSPKLIDCWSWCVTNRRDPKRRKSTFTLINSGLLTPDDFFSRQTLCFPSSKQSRLFRSKRGREVCHIVIESLCWWIIQSNQPESCSMIHRFVGWRVWMCC